jgi:hypothetical protein
MAISPVFERLLLHHRADSDGELALDHHCGEGIEPDDFQAFLLATVGSRHYRGLSDTIPPTRELFPSLALQLT